MQSVELFVASALLLPSVFLSLFGIILAEDVLSFFYYRGGVGGPPRSVWLRSSAVSILFSVATDMSPTGDLLVTLISIGDALPIALGYDQV